jgi:alpha-1,6-mannosyltransferase
MIKQKKIILAVLLTGILFEALLLYFVYFNGEGNIPLYMIIYFAAFIILFNAYLIIKKFSDERKSDASLPDKVTVKLLKFFKIETTIPSTHKIAFIIIGFGILFRITLFFTQPTTSPDVYRYIWEGKLIVHGYNPFEYAPNDDRLFDIHSKELPAKVTFKNMTAIYPPAAQYTFAAAYLIGGESFFGLRLLFLLCEIITMIFILKLLNLKEKDPALIILYAWLPLVIMEFFINIHLDALGIAFFIVFIYMIEKDKNILSAVFFALSFLTKFLPVLILPLLLKKIGLKKSILFFILFILVSVLFYLPFLSGEHSITKFISVYIQRWEFNGSVYKILKSTFLSGGTSRILCGAMLVISIGLIAIYYKRFINAIFAVLLCLTIFSTTVYPWYLGWLAAVNPFVGFYSVGSLMFLINFSNFTPLGEVWQEYLWVSLIQYIPFYFFLAIDLMIYRKKWMFNNNLNEA